MNICPSIFVHEYLHRFQVTADYCVKFSLQTGGRFILMHTLGWFPAIIAIK